MIRPVVEGAIDVKFGLGVIQMVDIDEADQSIQVVGTLRYEWKDQFLTWRPEMNGGIEDISLPPELVWK